MYDAHDCRNPKLTASITIGAGLTLPQLPVLSQILQGVPGGLDSLDLGLPFAGHALCISDDGRTAYATSSSSTNAAINLDDITRPTLIQLFAPDPKQLAWTPAIGTTMGKVLAWPFAHAKPIWIVSGLLVVASLMLVPGARFDSDPLNLRDPKSEAIMTFRDLLQDPELPTLTMSALVPDADTAARLSAELSKLPEVKRALSLRSFVPLAQDEKLPILEDIRDESDEQIRLVFVPKNRNVDPDLLKESLYRLSELEFALAKVGFALANAAAAAPASRAAVNSDAMVLPFIW